MYRVISVESWPFPMLSVALLLGFAGHAVAFAPGPVAGGVTGTAVVRTPQTLVATAADSPESILLALRESAQSAPAELTASLLSVGDTAERSAGELTRALTTAFTTAIAAPRSALEAALSTGAEWDAIPSPFSPPGGPPAFEAPESLISVASSMQEAAISALALLVDDPVAATTQLASVLQEPRTAAAAAFLVPLIAMAYQDLSAGGPASPYPAATYDAAASRGYFRRRPLAVFLRATELIARSSGFGVSVLADWLGGEESLRSKAPGRAEELAKLLTELGPTFIKAGQSASIRTDLLPPAYIEGLQQLQDQVPPFSSDEARRIITEELGSRPLVSLESLTTEPIAAASLGQVYKGRLQDGSEVAVKVQRPGMLYQIALDMYLIREFATPFAKLIGTPGDLVGTADAWGEGFVAELDYAQEATNAQRFTEQIIGSALEGRVFAPAVVGGASAGRVLTTEWVDGERLDRSSAPEDVPRLCSLAMNTYLEMMLEQGTLHCDPHPGNLLRTADGRLCVLDWGLVSTITPELQLTLIEHVAHLTAADYAKVPSDLVKLGFVPPGGEEVVRANGVSDFLSYTYSTWASGGGAAKLDVPALFNEVRKLAAGSADGIFQVPPYFAYIAKSFSVLEGIGLSVDKEYSIIQECLPYISRRIMTDPSPRTAGALETFIFGETKVSLSPPFCQHATPKVTPDATPEVTPDATPEVTRRFPNRISRCRSRLVHPTTRAIWPTA